MNANFSISTTLNRVNVSQSEDITPSEIGNKIKTVAKTMAQGMGLLLVPGCVSRIIDYSGFCLNEHIPSIGWDIGKIQSELYMSLYDQLPGGNRFGRFTGGNLFDLTIKGPSCEELFHRFFIQEMLLKQLPKKILQKYSPQNVSFVDCRIAQMARVLISSTLFTLFHLNYQKECNTLNRVFVMGLVLGMLQEKTGRIFASTTLHITANSLALVIKAME